MLPLIFLMCATAMTAQNEHYLEFVIMPSLSGTEFTEQSTEENERFHNKHSLGGGVQYSIEWARTGLRLGIDVLSAGSRRELADFRFGDAIGGYSHPSIHNGGISKLKLDLNYRHVSFKTLLLLSGDWHERVSWRLAIGPSLEIHQKSSLHSRYTVDAIDYEYRWTEERHRLQTHTLGGRVEADLRYSITSNSGITLGAFYRRMITTAESDYGNLRLTNSGLSCGYSFKF